MQKERKKKLPFTGMTKLEGRYFTSRDNSDIYVTKYGTSDIISQGMAPIPKEKAMTKA